MTWVILGHTFFFSLPYTDNPLVSSFLIFVTPFKQRIEIFIEDSRLNLLFLCGIQPTIYNPNINNEVFLVDGSGKDL